MVTTTSSLCLLVGLCLGLISCVSTVTQHYWEYIIVGAGPSGIQIGSFLQSRHRDYVVLERNEIAGSFFNIYPRHDKLISINKRYTGKTNTEFNLRHDWNSLLSDDPDLLFKQYSKDFFPKRTDILRYFNDFAEKQDVNIMYEREISGIKQEYNSSAGQARFVMHDQFGDIYTCKILILATGVGTPVDPKFEGIEYTESYEDISLDPDDYEGQTVLILGRGNSAFEVADGIYGVTNLIHMIGRSRVRLSWETHYVGDLRAVNNALLDTYQLKSLDGVLEAPLEEIRVTKLPNGKLRVGLEEPPEREGEPPVNMLDMFDNFAMRDPYDRIIRCLGFQFDSSIFANDSMCTRGAHRMAKFPQIHHNYESKNVQGMFYAGVNTHSLDHRKSAGGFIHGFRYTARALFNLLEWRYQQVPWPSETLPVSELLPYFFKRVNEASGIYQMFGFLGDVIALRDDGRKAEYYQEFPIKLLPDFTKHTGHQVDGVIVVLLEYGANFSGPGKDIFRLDRATGEPSEAHHSNFLHPVLYYYKELPSVKAMLSVPKWQHLPRPDRLHHVVEDFLTAWDTPNSHFLPVRRFLEDVLQEDMRNFFTEDCLTASMISGDAPLTCRRHYHDGRGIAATGDIRAHAKRAVMQT